MDPESLVPIEHEIFAAIARRDVAALDRLVAPDFILRTPGQPDTDKQAFLAGVTAIPGEILTIGGEDVRAHLSGEVGVVAGVQVARVRIDGKEIVDRGAFLDLFAWRDGRWVMTYAFNVPLP